MTKLQKFVSLKIYDNAGHGFENPNNAEAYRPEAAADAWGTYFDLFEDGCEIDG